MARTSSATNDYRKQLERQSRQKLLILTAKQEEEILQAYKRSGRNLIKKMQNTRGTAQSALLKSYGKVLYEDCSEIIKRYAMEGAEVPQELLSLAKVAEGRGLDTGPFQDIRQILGPTGKQMLERFERGDIYKDGKGLSQRIWEAAQQSTNDIHNIIGACLSQNMGAADMAKVLEKYVDPSAKKTWDRKKVKDILGSGYASWYKNLEYNSLRLARTTLSHSFTMGVKEAAKQNPFLETVTWHSAHAVPRTCQECMDRDGQVYTIKDVPFDHPNGLCWLTYNVPDLDTMARELRDWVNGDPNKKLDDWYNNFYKPMKNLGKGTTKSMSPEELEKYIKDTLRDVLNDKLGINKLGDYNDLLKTLAGTEDEDYVTVFLEHLKTAGKITHDGRKSSQYIPGEGSLNLPWKKIFDRANQFNLENKWSTLFHETGHRIDDMLNKVSKGDDFQAAMLKDIDNLVARIKKNPDDFNKILKDHNSQGVQDIVSAIKNMPQGKGLGVDPLWHHGDAYWKRENVYKEAASELWADISQTYAGGKVQSSYMKEWFPNSYKQFQKEIKKEANRLRKLKK